MCNEKIPMVCRGKGRGGPRRGGGVGHAGVGRVSAGEGGGGNFFFFRAAKKIVFFLCRKLSAAISAAYG